MNTVLQAVHARVRVFQLLTALVLVAMIAFLFSPGVTLQNNFAYAAQNTAGYGSGQGGPGGNDQQSSGAGGSLSGQGGQGSTMNEDEVEEAVSPHPEPVDEQGSSGGGGSGNKPSDVGGGSDGDHGMPDGVGGDEGVGNNLSFPVVTADGYQLTTLTDPSFSVVYDGPYTGLSEDEMARLVGHDWYAQKTEGNLWQAAFATNPVDEPLSVYGIDWGDNIEAVDPVIGRPYRLEVTLYHQPIEPMDGYLMELLAFPSSPNEVQGTNATTYDSAFATVLSSKPKLLIQFMGEEQIEDLVWTVDGWQDDGSVLPKTTIDFAPELNVGGKYIYGASKGGWRPVEPGIYRLTFTAEDSDISFAEAVVGNYSDWISTEPPAEEDEETHAATPVIDAENNLSFVDVTVVIRHESRKPEDPGGGEEDHDGEEEAALTIDSLAVSGDTGFISQCEPYLSDFLGIELDNDPIQVVLLQSFLNETLGTDLILNGIFDETTQAAVQLFQVTYAEDILEPWASAGHEDVSIYLGTGYVGVTTLEKINELMCDR